MGAFLKKDILVLIRTKTELLILLLMPFILIAILGFALRGLLGGDAAALHMQVALVHEDNAQQGVQAFVEELEARSLPEEVVQELGATAAAVHPYALLMEMLEGEELRELVETVEMEAAAAEQALMDEEVAAVLTIPEHFTERSLQKMLLDEGPGSELQITIADYASLRASVFEDIMTSFARSLNFETAIAQAAGGAATAPDSAAETGVSATELGGVETIVSTREPINSIQYYTLGVAVMFALFVAGTISSKAYVEKLQHVFNRILLSGQHPFVYLGGKAISTAVIAFLQLCILFVLSSLIFRSFGLESVTFWLGMAVISAALAVCVGTIGALLTALTLRFNNEAMTFIFTAGLVSIFAFAGGSFFPVSDMPQVVRYIGQWTPNGAALSAYLQWMQGLEAQTLIAPLLRISGLSVLCLLASLFVFPRRRSV